MDLEEKVAKITSTFARTDDPWRLYCRIELVEQQQLYLCMHFPLRSTMEHTILIFHPSQITILRGELQAIDTGIRYS